MQTSFGRKPILLLCCAAFCAQFALSQPALEPDGTIPQSRPVSRTLADLGHSNGFGQSGNYSSIQFVLPMPVDTAVSNARLVLHYAASSTQESDAVIQVSLNGDVRLVTSLAEAPGATGRGSSGAAPQRILSVPLSGEDLRQPALNVTVRTSFDVAEPACPRPQLSGESFRILPQTSLSYRAQPDADPSVRGFLSTLPTNTRIAIAPGINAEGLRAVWLITHALHSRGNRVSFTTPNEAADILVSPRSELDGTNANLPQEMPLGLVRREQYLHQLVITEPYQVDALAAPWHLMLSSREHAGSTSGQTVVQNPANPSLGAMGLNTEARAFTGQAEWSFTTHTLPAGRTPSALHLDLIVPPSSDQDPLVLYVLQNETVRGLTTLSAEGGEQRVSVPLRGTESSANGPIRIVLMRQSHQDCGAAATAGYVQLLPSSELETQARDRQARSIAEFSKGLSEPFTVHLPDDAADQPQGWARALASLSRSLNIEPRQAELRSLEGLPSDAQPFIWFGDQPPPGFDSPVSVSRGRILVRDPSGGVLLDTAEVPEASMVSLLRDGSRRGLWVRTLGQGVPVIPSGLAEGSADLVFGDEHGVMVSLATRSERVASITYPERQSLASDLGRFRIWFFALAWLALTIVVIAVARRMRKH